MLRKLLSTTFVLFLAVCAYAQSGKPKIMFDAFTYADGVTFDDADRVRQCVFNAMSETKRFDLTDVALLPGLDDTGKLAALAEGGYNYKIEGSVLSFDVVPSKLDDGTVLYKCHFSYSLTVTDLKSTKTLASKTFQHNGNSLGTLFKADNSSPEGAVNSIALEVKTDMKEMAVECFPLEGQVIPVDYVVEGKNENKKEIVSCYINLGEDNGVKKGDYFQVTMPSNRAGRTVYTKVARLKVEEVVDGSMSNCKVIDGEKEFYRAMSAFLELDEATKAERPFKVEVSAAKGLKGLGKELLKF